MQSNVIKSKVVSSEGVELTLNVRLNEMSTKFANSLKSLNGVHYVVKPDTPEYTEQIFDKDKVMTINIQVDEEDFKEMLDNAVKEEYIACDIRINGEHYEI